MEHSKAKVHCLSRPTGSGVKSNSHEGWRVIHCTKQSFISVSVFSRGSHLGQILHLGTRTGTVRARRQLCTGEIRSKQKKGAWHRLCLIKSAFREEY